MIKPSINLQELRRRIYRKAKAEKTRRFWGLHVHVCKLETLRAAYQAAKANDGTPGIDGESFPSIEARGGVKLILEAIFEADFHTSSFAYRAKRTAHQALDRVVHGLVRGLTRVIDVDLKSYFDNIRHHLLLQKLAMRVKDPAILHLVKQILKANGKRGVPQGGVLSPPTQSQTLSLNGWSPTRELGI